MPPCHPARSTVDVPRTPAVGHPCHPGVMRSVTGAAAISSILANQRQPGDCAGLLGSNMFK